MSDERLIIECSHCGMMYDISARQLAVRREFRCRGCKRIFEAAAQWDELSSNGDQQKGLTESTTLQQSDSKSSAAA